MKNVGKRLLALLLVSVMILTGTVSVFADAEVGAVPAVEEIQDAGNDAADVVDESDKETLEDSDKNVSEDNASQEEAAPTANVSDDENIETDGEVLDEEAGIPAAISDTDEGIAVAAIKIGEKPQNGTTSGQPFPSGTGGSSNFRIPALVTLSDGTLVAASDARWNTDFDGGGLDTIVSRSSDNGASWNYTFANYLGDNGNVYSGDSTAFIDPAMAVTSDNTIYMLVDLYPHGTYIGNVKAGTGFDDNGHLLLRESNGSSFDYYVGDFSNGTANIYKTDGTQVEGYTVDAYYNIIGDKISTNLFFSDSPYQVLSTSYLYLTKSTDKGATWSAPQMLNSQVKTPQDMFYGVGPGRGLVTSNGRIIFPCYTYTTTDGSTSVIYSDDNGQTWTRSKSMTEQSSEAALTEADGKIYMFTRHGGYYVSSDNGATWSEKQNVNGISYTTTCQLSAITYSKKIDGKTAILLSAPTSGRNAGKIFVGLVQDDGSINWAYTYQVNDGAYAYSCLTELNDGSIGLLYENAGTAITYTNLAISDIVKSEQIGEIDKAPSQVSKTENVTLYVGQSKTITDSTGNYEDSYTGAGLNTGIATVDVKGTTVEGGTSVTPVNSVSNGSTVYIQTSEGNYLTSSAKTTTDINEAAQWTLSSNSGGYRLKSGSNYLRYRNNSGLTTTTSSNNATIFYFNNGTFYRTYGWSFSGYTYSNPIGNPVNVSTTDPVAATEITLTGVAVGSTSVVVGDTAYTIEVKEMPPYVNVDTSPFVAQTGVGKGKKITKLTTSVGLTYTIGLNTNGHNVEWSVEDSSIATVDQYGNVTGVKAGETTVTATIDGVAYTIPVVIRQDTTSNNTKIYDLYLSEVTDTTVYYSVSVSTDLIEAQEGEAIYISFKDDDNTALDFFAKPDDGYALTRMSSTNSAGDYMALNSDNPSETDFCTKSGAAGSNQKNTFGADAVYAMVQEALNKKCDGGMGWTRPSDNTSGVTSDVTFRSEKLPTVSKKVATVNGETYTEGMVAHVGEKVVFDITVTQYAAQDNIAYSNATLTDNLKNAVFTDSRRSTQSVSGLSDNALNQNKEITYQVEYTITDADLDKTITNTVDLSYTYKSQYSSGSFGGTANADAKFTAASFTPQDIVIDFGLPVELDFSGEDAHGRYNLSSGSAVYGDVTVSNNKVTYTPNTVLLEADTVTLTNSEGGAYTFKVYPATSVYYEEGFATDLKGGWSVANKGNGKQAASFVGSKELYGYDAHYASNNGNSDETTSTAGTTGAEASFIFNGTGLDVYTLTTGTSGAMSMWLYNADTNALLKFGYVDTHQEWLANNTGNYYNTPVFSYKDLDAGTNYKVVMKVVSGEVSLDGFRVYNTKGASYQNIYAQDQEDNADVVEVRDVAIAGVSVNINEVDDWYTYGNRIINAVYDATNNGEGAIVLNSSGTELTVNADMVNNGPKNEIYLEKGQAVAMDIKGTADKVALGMRSLNGGAISCKINSAEVSMPGSSTVDMYYEVSLSNGKLVVQNTGDNVLALTKLKATEFNGNAGTRSLAKSISADADTVAFALRCMANIGEVELADATANVNLVDYTGKVLATTALSENGEVGAEAVFGTETIKAAAKQVLPEGYAFVDESSIADQTVVCGESTDVNVQIGKVATLKITYKKMLGKTVGTTTLTAVQTSSTSSYTFSASEIKKGVPDGYWTGTLVATKVKFGAEGTRTVYVL